MDHFEDFVSGLLREGRAVVRETTGPVGEPSAGVAAALAGAYEDYRLDVAGPAVPFDAAVACEAAGLVRQACRALLSRGDRAGGPGRLLRMSHPPSRPSDHLSADLMLRFLPQVHRRARAVDPSGPLAAGLAGVLRQWPLSGVLSDLDDGPDSPPDFGGHPGLLLLYAERYAAGGPGRPAWSPGGEGLGYVELVARERERVGGGSRR